MSTTHTLKLIRQATQLHAAGKLDQATRIYLQILSEEPGNFEALSLSGAAALQSGDAAGAEELIKQALSHGKLSGSNSEQQRRLGDAYNNLAIALQKQRKFDEAVPAAREALKYRGNDADLLANAGFLLKEVGQYEESEALLRKSIGVNPRHTRALIALALILYITDRRDEAEKTISAALRVEPNSAAALSLKGNLLVARYAVDEALHAFNTAIKHEPNYSDALYNRALLYLALGRFSEAWPDFYKHHPVRRWTPGNEHPVLPARLDGKHVFVNRNQGVGDELFYLRFMPLLKARGATISYRTEDRMRGFVERMGGIDQVIPDEVKRFNADYIVLVDQLPYLLQLTDEDVPPSVRLVAKPDSLRRVAVRLQAAGPPPYLGVTWRAGRMRDEVNFKREATEILFKDIPVELLAEPLRHWPGTILILQRNPRADEVAGFQQTLGRSAVDVSDINNDLEDMLALVSMIERYVTVSNTNVHLRAAARLPSHVLVPLPPEWRWGFGERSPWFPDCPLYRQSAKGDWQEALTKLGNELLL